MLRFHRILIVYAAAIPLAVILGYLVAEPNKANVVMVGALLAVLALPLLLRLNRWLLIFCWNSAFVAGFLPSEMPLWVVAAVLAFGIAVTDHVMGHKKFLHVPELTKPILALLAVVVLTAKIRGGLGLRMFGASSIGGKHYLYILAAIMGYFALTAEPIPLLKRAQAVKCFYLSGLSHMLTHLAFVMGPFFYIFYLILPASFAATQARSEYYGEAERLGGLGLAADALLCFVLARWGIRGVFDWRKLWRPLLLVAALGLSMLCGYRSQFVFLVMILGAQFVTEGLWKTSFLPFFAAAGVGCVMVLMLVSAKMPLNVQRTMSFLPMKIDPVVREEAELSSQWRIDMWNSVLPTVPKYLVLGKGYGIDQAEVFSTQQLITMGLLPNYAGVIVVGDYHSGGLSLLIPLGVFGSLAFLWMLVAGIKVLYRNRRYGDPQLRRVNDLLLSFFLAQSFYYFFVFGVFDTQLYVFLGVLGFSVALNGGVRRREIARPVPANPAEMALAPA